MHQAQMALFGQVEPPSLISPIHSHHIPSHSTPKILGTGKTLDCISWHPNSYAKEQKFDAVTICQLSLIFLYQILYCCAQSQGAFFSGHFHIPHLGLILDSFQPIIASLCIYLSLSLSSSEEEATP